MPQLPRRFLRAGGGGRHALRKRAPAAALAARCGVDCGHELGDVQREAFPRGEHVAQRSAERAEQQHQRIRLGGGLRDVVSDFATAGTFGPDWAGIEVGYVFVYSIELLLLLATLMIVAPLALRREGSVARSSKMALDQFPS